MGTDNRCPYVRISTKFPPELVWKIDGCKFNVNWIFQLTLSHCKACSFIALCIMPSLSWFCLIPSNVCRKAYQTKCVKLHGPKSMDAKLTISSSFVLALLNFCASLLRLRLALFLSSAVKYLLFLLAGFKVSSWSPHDLSWNSSGWSRLRSWCPTKFRVSLCLQKYESVYRVEEGNPMPLTPVHEASPNHLHCCCSAGGV